MQVTLIRHGKTAGNLAGRYVGRNDVPLCPEGVEEAERAKKDAARSVVYVSPLLRARQTANILFPNARQTVVEDLKEMDFGDFEGRTADEMADDPVYRKWVEDFCVGACPNGESQAGFRKRVTAALSETLKSAKDDVVIVAHGGVIMAIMAELAEPKKDFYDWYTPNLCGYRATVRSGPSGIVLFDVQPVRYPQ